MPKCLILITVISVYIFIISHQSIYVLAQEKNPISSDTVTISTGIITALGAIGGAVAGSYFTVYNASRIENRKNEQHQQYNVTLRETLIRELKILRSILDYVKNNSDTYSDNGGKYYVFRGRRQELPRMSLEGYLVAVYYDVPLEQRVEAFGSDLINISFAHNKIQHIFRLLYDQTSTSNSGLFPLYDSLIVDLDKILSQVKS
jgi:hypothetical protein